MIHYHGTPITPRRVLLEMAGRHFCISFAHPHDLRICLEIGQSLMLDNGAFTAFTQGKVFDIKKYYAWLDEYLVHPHWAVVPDVIDGTVEQQRELIKQWPFPRDLSAPVWHLGLPLDWLFELVDHWPKVCLGSSGHYWQIGTQSWCRRMDDVFNALHRRSKHLPWLHGMRMLGQSDGPWPLASADSTNVARNHHAKTESAETMAHRIDSTQPARKWHGIEQLTLEAME